MNKKLIILSQIAILLFGIIAISYAVGSEIGIVSADARVDKPTTPTPTGPSKRPVYPIDSSSSNSGPTQRFNNKISQNVQPTGSNPFFEGGPGKTIDGLDMNAGIGGHLLTGLFHAGIAKTIVTWLAKQGLGQTEEQAETLGEAAGAGVLAAHLTQGGIEQWYNKNYGGESYLGNAGIYVGIVVAAYYIWENYKDVDTRSVTFECTVWEAPKGGANCEKCNDNFFGCNEYQCKSLGKGCELLNPGTEEELCTWVNRNDAEAPEIRPWNDVLADEYKYSPDTTISPPDRGVKIIPKTNANGCIPAYTNLRFGISLDEPATCKIDMERKDTYEDMQFYFGSSSLATYNHSHTMSLPSLNATGTILESGLNLSMFVRCEDANGNSNIADFVFKFCVEQEEDFTSPLIVETGVANNQPIGYNLTQIDTKIFVNEPATCKWDFSDKTFDTMENGMVCDTNSIVKNAQIVYPCDVTLTGIKDRVENDFYLRCEDTSGNVNKESYKLTLIGTKPLYIDWVEPEGTIKDATSPIKATLEVQTSSGAEDGKAFCFYKPSTRTGSYIQFKYNPVEMTYQHMQELTNLVDGNYNYSIKCVDAGGNSAFSEVNFNVKTDRLPPVVVRAYKEDNYLKLITDESGECVYNTDDEIGCRYEYENGIKMQTVEDTEHFVEWNSQETFYIKCKDEFNIPPNYDSCSITARPSAGQII